MRILVVIHEFPPIGGGGGRVAFDLAKGLVDRGHDVRILTARMRGLPSQERIDNIQIDRVRSLRRFPYKADLMAMGGYVVAGAWSGFRMGRRWQPDIIHAHFAVPGGPIAWFLSRSLGKPYVLTVHLGDIPGGVPEKTGDWFRWVYPLTPPVWSDASRVVAVSEYARQLALKHYPVEIEVIYNGVDLKVLNPGVIQTHSPVRIVFAGRFMPQKNPVELVRVLGRLKSFEWECTLLGDGPLRDEIEGEIITNKLQNRIRLTGWVTPEEVISSLKESDILFMPSISESFPVVGVQALSMGLAIVASKVGGFVELVDQGVNGFLVESGDTEGYQLGLESLISDPNRLLDFRKASRKKAQEFDINLIVEKYEALFSRVVNSKED